jgi:hypothetical protein
MEPLSGEKEQAAFLSLTPMIPHGEEELQE